MARWPINSWIRVMAAIAISSDCISIGIVVKLIAISLDCVLMKISSNQSQSAWIMYRWMLTVVSMVALMVGSTVGSTWLCWAINLSEAWKLRQEAFTAISWAGLTGLSWNKLIILQTCFTGFIKQTHCFTGSFRDSLNASFNSSFNG